MRPFLSHLMSHTQRHGHIKALKVNTDVSYLAVMAEMACTCISM